jgi:hypothetical protein
MYHFGYWAENTDGKRGSHGDRRPSRKTLQKSGKEKIIIQARVVKIQ